MKATNEFHNPIGAFRRKVDYNHEKWSIWSKKILIMLNQCHLVYSDNIFKGLISQALFLLKHRVLLKKIIFLKNNC